MSVGPDLERLEIAGPGFLNLFMTDAWHRRAVGGDSRIGTGPSVDGAPLPQSVARVRIGKSDRSADRRRGAWSRLRRLAGACAREPLAMR